MSLAQTPVEVRKIPADGLSYAKRLTYPAVAGATSTTWQRYSIQGTPTNDSLQINCVLPSTKHCVGRRAFLRTTLTFNATCASVPAGGFCIPAQTVAPRQFPLHSAMTNAQCTVGQQNFTLQNPTQSVHALLSQFGGEELVELAGGTPHAFDNVQVYDSLRGAQASILNDFTFGDCDDDVVAPRGAFAGWTIAQVANGSGSAATTGPSTTAVLTLTVCEPILVNPFCLQRDQQAIRGVSSINFQFNFANHVARMLSRLSDPLASGQGAVSITPAPQLFSSDTAVYLEIYSPSPLAPISSMSKVELGIPHMNLYGPLQSTAIAAGASSDMQSGVIQLNSIPKQHF